jgi:hypothetical protein
VHSNIIYHYWERAQIKVYKDEFGRPKGDALVTFKYNDNKVSVPNFSLYAYIELANHKLLAHVYIEQLPFFFCRHEMVLSGAQQDVAANAVKYLDGHEVDQGALGTYTIGASVAKYKEKAKVVDTGISAWHKHDMVSKSNSFVDGGSYDPFSADGEPMVGGEDEPQQPSVVLENMFEVHKSEHEANMFSTAAAFCDLFLRPIFFAGDSQAWWVLPSFETKCGQGVLQTWVR